MLRRTTLFVLLLALFATVASAQHFTPVAPTGLPYAIAIEYGKVGNTVLEPGDEVAAFDNGTCVGAITLTGYATPETALGFTAWEGDVNQGLPGFTPGNSIEIRVFRAGAPEFVANTTWTLGGNFGDGFGSVASMIDGGQARPVVLDISPNGPAVIPFGGGLFFYHVMLQNQTPMGGQVQARADYVFQNGSSSNVLQANVNLNPNQTINVDRSEYVPCNAPAGYFWFVVEISYNGLVVSSDVMAIEKLSSVVDGAMEFDYDFGQAEIADADFNAVEVPAEFELGHAYPNPFNPTTTLSVALPQANNLKVAVFNTLGREVAVLNNSRVEAGNYSFTFDAASLSSGVYFIQANAGAETAIQKVTLLK